MKFKTRTLVAALASAAAMGTINAHAGTEVWFNPLTNSAYVGVPNHPNELGSPWVAPAGITQTNLTSLSEIEADLDQSVIRAPGAESSASMIDMVAFDRRGRYIFLPHETPWGAGVSRYDVRADENVVLFQGDGNGRTGNWTNDYGAFDPALVTPQQTVWAAEEWTGEGRVIEIVNPFAAPEKIRIRELQSIANVAHEGLRFGADNKTLYFVDEWNSGSIYKLVFKNPRNYTQGGQTFVLVIDAFKGNAADNFNEPSNAAQPRVGAATWVPITDADGKPLTKADPFKNGPTNDPRTNPDTRGGRPAADEVNGAPYGRPEDIEVGKLANGHEVVYFAATSERSVYSIEILPDDKATVRLFASDAKTPKNLGFAPTSGVMNSPDNLELDALGNLYIIEDAPNSDVVGGDVWFAQDVDGDGVSESIYHFLSLGVNTAEATGMEFNPRRPTRFVMAIQHPKSTDLLAVPGGFGDALWEFNIAGVVPPPCELETDIDPVTGEVVVEPVQDESSRVCSDDRDSKFVRMLRRANRQ